MLRLFGPRATVVSRSSPSRLTSLAARFGDAFARAYPEFTFSAQELAAQVPKWALEFKWPFELSTTPNSEDEALSDFLRVYRYAKASLPGKSSMIADVFDKVLAFAPMLKLVCGRATPLQAFNALRASLKVFDLDRVDEPTTPIPIVS